MIRTETNDGWLLVSHPHHAHLAGQFADAWGNALFPQPQPFKHVREAVYCHDDGWMARDAQPFTTKQGKPEAFSRELVGKYSAFEEIDLPAYLKVRGEALEAVASRDRFAAIIVSKHTVNLLADQADITTIRPEQQQLHADFIASQRNRQKELVEQIRSSDPELAPLATEQNLDAAFKFLQCCDSLSLMICVHYEQPRPLRHAQPVSSGGTKEILCTPRGDSVYALNPWPFREERQEFSFGVRRLSQKTFGSLEEYRAAFANASVELHRATLIAG